MNSSPPWRAATSVERIVALRRWATSISRRSPARCPSESLTTLKLSMSRKRTRDLCPAPPTAGQGPLDVVAEEDPIGEPGQRIVKGIVEELLLESLLLGGVDDAGPARRAGRRDVPSVMLKASSWTQTTEPSRAIIR